ncbi:uncharacterized protein TNCV_165091 [Trichonephila clavipes]|nr:uncharacterized protein TNCV_165091 [Trichonephila clavipes]
MLGMLSPDIHSRRTNIIMLVILSIPIMYSVTSILAINITSESLFFAYGYELKTLTMRASVVCIKKLLSYLFHTTFPSLVTVLFCCLCLRFSFCFNCLTQKILNYSPDEFGPSQQKEILRQKAKLDDILENLQDIFSLPSVFMTITYLFTCCSAVGMSVIAGNYSKLNVLKTVFYGIPNLVSLIVLLWIAGSIPVEQHKLKGAFYKRAHYRFLTVVTSEEPQCKREILEKTDLVLNGCGIFFYTRNSIVAVFGTLLTYSLLIYQN